MSAHDDARSRSTVLAAAVLGSALAGAVLMVALAISGNQAAQDAVATAAAPTSTPPEAIVPSIEADFAAAEALLAGDPLSDSNLNLAYAALDRAADAVIRGPDSVRALLREALARYPRLRETLPFYVAQRIIVVRDTGSRGAARRALAGVALEYSRSQQILMDVYLGELIPSAAFHGIDYESMFEDAAAWASAEPPAAGQQSTRDYLLIFTRTYKGD